MADQPILHFDASAWLDTLDGARGVFVAGTDTEVGKTYVSCALIRALTRAHLRVAGMKPVAAGSVVTAAGGRNEDALALAAAANVAAPYHAINPYCLTAPVSPHLAAADEGVTIEMAQIQEGFATLATLADFIVVEGAGGWLAPIGPERTMADVAVTLGLPVILVVGLRLGCLNHSLLTRRAIEVSGLRFAGWIGNRIDQGFKRAKENIETLDRMLGMAPIEIVEQA